MDCPFFTFADGFHLSSFVQMYFMKLIFIVGLLAVLSHAFAQRKEGIVRKLEACACPIKVDSSFKTVCAYLVVPENRKKNNGKSIKLPFVIVESKNPLKNKDPFLYTTGGPGGSSLGWAEGVPRRSPIANRDCIAFEQRGTRFSIPQLSTDELDIAIKESYRKNLDKDSMVIDGVKRYRRAMEAKGIDLSGYNTDESVADIDDLLTTLQIDSVNLFGGSYSGGLMMAVLQKDPARVRSLVLDSPLPTFIPIDQEEPRNFIEALDILLSRVEKDSTNKQLYGNIRNIFRQYFTSLIGKQFYLRYLEPGTTDSISIAYTKNDLLDIIVGSMFDPSNFKNVAFLINDIASGNHEKYMLPKLDNIFSERQGPNAMRISVYCADQAAFNDLAVLEQLYTVYPFMKGYHINNVYKAMCDCWNVPPIKKETKQQFYSAKPVLLADGLMDAACRPIYIDRIHHYMPNSQRLLFTNMAHMVGNRYFDQLIGEFLNNPFKKLISVQEDVVVY
jgi:pimeloyl-ACP methyl ester carboxylesterase